MYNSHSCPVSPADSLSNLSAYRSGYIKLPTCVEDKAGIKRKISEDFSSYSKKSLHKKNRTCISNVFSFLYRFLVRFLRIFCFRLPQNVDNESLINVDYKRELKGEDQSCRILFEKNVTNSSLANHTSLCVYSNNCGITRPSYVVLFGPEGVQERSKQQQHTAVTLNKIHDSQHRSKVIASKGKDQMTATKVAVSKSKQQLKQVKDDVSNIRGDIEAAKKLFSEIEKGIQEYKWDAFTRDTWAVFEYQGGLCYLPISAKSKYHDPFQEMYSDHRIFIEEMKFHFKWNHGVML